VDGLQTLPMAELDSSRQLQIIFHLFYLNIIMENRITVFWMLFFLKRVSMITNDEMEFYIMLHGWHKSTGFDIDGTICQWVEHHRRGMLPLSLKSAYLLQRKNDDQ
jgi:hypothetical protein